MDKKKVKELIEKIDFIAHDFIDGDKQEELQNLVSEVQEELNKSDWVSVEDGLPEYGEVVLVVCETYPSNMWPSKRMDRFESGCTLDNHSFKTSQYLPIITHWKPIEKLEE